MEPDNDIKRRPDGSIDTGYYLQIGRNLRSAKAHELAKQIVAGTDRARTGAIRGFFNRVHPAGA